MRRLGYLFLACAILVIVWSSVAGSQPSNFKPSGTSAGYLTLKRGTPGSTTDTLDNPSGVLRYNGTAVTMGGGTGMQLQATTPGSAQTGHGSITGSFLAGGNLGVGLTDPSFKIHAKGTTGAAASARVEATAADSISYFVADNDASGWSFGINGTNSDAFQISNAFGLGTPKLTILTGGNVGIGITSPSTALDVSGTVTATAMAVNQQAYYDGVVSNGDSGATKTIDWTAGNIQSITTTAACVLTFTAPTGPCHLTLKVIHEASATAYAYTWPGTVKWQSAVAPTTTNTSGAVDVINFFFDGATYYGTFALDLR